MTLGFMQQFPWKEPTNFREKILAGAGYIRITGKAATQFGVLDDILVMHGESNFVPKLHTFRADPHNRWKAGRKIEMVYRGAGYKILDHFNKGIPELEKCVSTQNIKISCIVPPPSKKNPRSDPETYWPKIEVDGRIIGVDGDHVNKDEIVKLVQNDGFESITQFVMWFKEPWEGKILHFTDLKY